MQFDYIYDSAQNPGEIQAELGYEQESVTILFRNEGITVQADRFGRVSFAKEDGTVLHQEVLDPNDSCFSRACVTLQGNEIRIRLILIHWEDHYPHCDGEHDRWSEIIVGERCSSLPLT